MYLWLLQAWIFGFACWKEQRTKNKYLEKDLIEGGYGPNAGQTLVNLRGVADLEIYWFFWEHHNFSCSLSEDPHVKLVNSPFKGCFFLLINMIFVKSLSPELRKQLCLSHFFMLV